MSNTITAYFKGRVGVAESVYQNDYGIVMAFDSIDLPAHFDCYFSRLNQEEALPGLGADNRVTIPNSILANPGNVTIHIPLHTGENDSEVEYVIYFKVIGRARPIDDGTPAQMTAIERALALLSQPITNIEEIVNEALDFTGETFDEMREDLDEWKEGVEGGLTTWKSGVESDFDNLEAQFNTAVAAVTTDTEVTNIRVGDDNVTYTTAGEAVRKQFADVKSDLSNGLEQMGNGKIIETGFVWEVGTIIDGADTYNAYVYRTKGYYSTSDVDYVESLNSAEQGRVVYYEDNQGSYAEDYTNFNSIVGLKQEINKEYPYYRVYFSKSEYGSLPDLNDVILYKFADFQESIDDLLELQDDVSQLETETAKIKEATVSVVPIQASVSFDVVEKKLLNPDGTLADFNNSGWKVTELIDISSFDSLIITAGSGYNHLLYAFYNETETFISGLDSGSGVLNITNESVNIPTGAKYIKVSRNGNAEINIISVIITYQNSANQNARWNGKKWTVVGDSLTAINERTTKHYFDYVAEATGITVVNMGDSGSGYRTEQDVDTAFYQRISDVPLDSDVVTIFGSFNDGLTDLGTATDSGTTTVGGCVNTTIDNLYAVFPTVQLGIVSPTPWVGANPYNHPEANAYADLLEAICKRRSIPFLNLYYESNLRPWDSTFRTLAYSKDDGNGVHPDETGHKIIASRFLGFLDSLLV